MYKRTAFVQKGRLLPLLNLNVMNIQEIDFLLSIYKNEQTPFWYYRDKYAVQLLTYFLGAEMKMNALKTSSHQNFLTKPPLKEITANLSNNCLKKADLHEYLPKDWLNFNLTYHRWGGYEKYPKHSWYQTTRPGYSFVIQLNFDTKHDTVYHELICPKRNEDPLFKTPGHPVAKKQMQLTLAWARLDVDLTTGEVLIEEVQTDWIREVDRLVKRITQSHAKKEREKIRDCWLMHYADTSLYNLKQYQAYLAPYKKIWQEIMMSATLDFCVKELGIRDIYFHTYKSGCELKDCAPPKSIYTKLPKQFGFKQTKVAPQFIQLEKTLKKKIRQKEYWWWRLVI